MASRICLKIAILMAVFLTFTSIHARAQDPVFSQFMFDALSVNPGFAGINDYIKFSAGFKDQWPLMKHAYITYYAEYDQKLQRANSGIGFRFTRDVASRIYSKTSGELYYNYQLKVDDFVISHGIQLGLAQRAFKVQDLLLPDQNPYYGNNTETLADKTRFMPEAAVGVVANYRDRLSFGLAAYHLFGIKKTDSEINNGHTPVSLSAHVISYIPIRFGKFSRYQLVLSPGAYVNYQNQNFYSQLGLNIAYNPVFIGTWLRSTAPFSPESLVLLVGIEQDNYRVVYNYDYKFIASSQTFPNTGAHEISVAIKIIQKEKKRTIKCTKYGLSRF